jgi:type IV pilus assembly protein PilB
VLATLHTEDAVGAVLRLVEMGVEPFLAASTISAVVAQRLIRRVCSACRRPSEPRRDDLAFLGIDRGELAGAELVAGVGCARCANTGYKGRLGIHELLIPDDHLREGVLRQSAARELRVSARALQGYFTLQEDGVIAALAGQTTLSEVVENVPRDPEARTPTTLRNETI